MKDIMAGIDLHSNNLMLALVHKDGRRLMHQKLACDLKGVEQALAPYRKRIQYDRGRVDFQLVLAGRWVARIEVPYGPG
jgi:hypothetical protein